MTDGAPSPSRPLPPPVMGAIERDDSPLLSALPTDWTKKDGKQVALAYASKVGAVNVIRELLSRGDVDPNIGRRATSPLCVAAANGQERAVDVLMEDPKIDPNRRRQDGVTPLVMAVQQRHYGIMRRLLADPRTDVNAKTLYPLRLTALLVALRQHDVQAAFLLLSDPRTDLGASKYERDDVETVAEALDCPEPIQAMLHDRKVKGAIARSLEHYTTSTAMTTPHKISESPDTPKEAREEGKEPSPDTKSPYKTPQPDKKALDPDTIKDWPRVRLIAELVSLSHRCRELEDSLDQKSTLIETLQTSHTKLEQIKSILE